MVVVGGGLSVKLGGGGFGLQGEEVSRVVHVNKSP